MATATRDDRGLIAALLGDGRSFLSLTAIALMLSGGFAIFQSVTGHFLPHDVAALGMDASHLAQAANPKVVRFMFHDRVAFGGTLLAIGWAYLWLAEFPLRSGAAWAWWTFAISGGCGFLSFMAYLGHGYLDSWHGVATLFLLPVWVAGVVRSRVCVFAPLTIRSIWAREPLTECTTAAAGRKLLVLCAAGLLGAGATILVVGMTRVFVPQDIAFMGVSAERLRALSPTLVPLIAHDRAGFGGGVFSIGVILLMMMRHAPVTRSLVEVIVLMGVCGFGAALSVHFAVGYTDFFHLSPAYAGFFMFLIGAALLGFGLRAAPPVQPLRQPGPIRML